MTEDIPLFPIAGWQLGPIHQYGLVALTFDFLSHPMQKIEESQQSQMFALTADQARELIQRLQSALDQLDSGEGQGHGVPHH